MHSERELVDRMKEGMTSAFDKLYENYSNRLYHFALSNLKSKQDAEEVVQNTFFKIWEKRNSIDSSHPFKSFLFSIAYHTTIDLLRERLKERKYRDIILASASAEYNPEEALEFGDLLEQVEQIVSELPPRKLEIYTLSRKKHLSYSEISEQLGITIKTVENSINFSLHFIKTRLGRDSILILLLAELFL